jgi:hypothetical protein
MLKDAAGMVDAGYGILPINCLVKDVPHDRSQTARRVKLDLEGLDARNVFH